MLKSKIDRLFDILQVIITVVGIVIVESAVVMFAALIK